MDITNKNRSLKINKQFIAFLLLLTGISIWNLGLNDIWMKNEAFYAESVREMLELGSYIIPYYNYEPRLQKPPLTYWLILPSVKLFGLNEFAIRLPMVILGVLSAVFTYLLARIFSEKVAFFSGISFGFASQIVANMRYASPEIPLLFFFTASLYFFLKGYRENKPLYFYLFYLFVGLTVLVKGFPYYIVIGFILFLFFILERITKNIGFLNFLQKIHFIPGVVLAIIVGGWWYLYVFLEQGNWFLKAVNKETFHRAFNYHDFLKELRPFFYLWVLVWAFLPYSFVSFVGILKLLKDKRFYFFLSWLLGMYIVFTLSRWKIPNYFIQAFPAIAVFAGYTLAEYKNFSKLWKYIFYLSLLSATLFIFAYLFYGLYQLEMIFVFVLILLPILLLLLQKKSIYIPLYAAVCFYIVLVAYISPLIEKYRPYKEIGNLILSSVPDRTIPIFVEEKTLNNLTFYAKRKVYSGMNIEEILKHKIPYVAVVYEKNRSLFENSKILWCGWIYKNKGDSRILTLLKYVIKAEKGDFSGFDRMCVIFKRGESWKK